MADNNTLPATGDVIASNDIAGVKYQRAKNVIGAPGTAVDQVPVVNGLDSTATGVAAAGLVAQLDDTSPSTVTENQFGPVRMSARRALLVEGPTIHDDPVAGNPQLLAGYAKAAAPSDVSADADVVRLWALRNGALATVLTAAGALIGGDAPYGLDVDVKRLNDPAATTGSLTAADAATTSSANAAGQTQTTGSPTAGSFVTCPVSGNGTALLQLSGTASTTCAFERSFDGGTTYTPLAMERVGVGDGVASQAMTDNKAYFFRTNVAGMTHVRVRCTTYTSGTVTVRWQPSIHGAQMPVNQGVPQAVANAWPVKRTDGTNTAPAMDVVARAGFQKITDGTLAAGLVDETGASAVDALAVGGGTPHDSVNSGNPQLDGREAIAHGTNPTAVAAGDRTKLYANRGGVPFAIGGHPNVVSYGMSITTGVTNAIIGPTIGSGLKLVVTSISFVLDNASTVFPSVVIGFGASTTPAFATTPGTAKVIAGHPACPAGGGMTKGDGSGMIGVGGDDEELRITTVGTAGGNGLYVLMTGYTVES